MTEMHIIKIEKKIAEKFVLEKHYSRRVSIFWEAYGLVESEKIVGVVVYGQPSPPIQRSAFRNRDFKLYELSRLVIQTKTKNAASFLIGNSLKLLKKPSAVVSYADSEFFHCGFVYQATNWLYTGATVSHDHLYLVEGKKVHPITLRDRGISDPKRWARENHIATIKPSAKHRYFFLNGNKIQRRKMRDLLNYPVKPTYPKSNPNRYDDGAIIEMLAPMELAMT